jgi:hypothetical protein
LVRRLYALVVIPAVAVAGVIAACAVDRRDSDRTWETRVFTFATTSSEGEESVCTSDGEYALCSSVGEIADGERRRCGAAPFRRCVVAGALVAVSPGVER